MFTTAQFRVFSGESEERSLVRPRHLLRDGNRTQAEAAYLDVLRSEPDLKAAWAEYFQLLRAEGRFDDALALADRAIDQFEGDAFSGALKGAALVEMGRFRPALEFLQGSAEKDPDFGMVWHEMGYAAYRLGEYSRALMVLDRAFALDPRSGTLHLRGKILRRSGQYLAAEVAFAGAAEAAEFPEQRMEAERQIAITRRYATFGRKPLELSPHELTFAEHGTVFLSSTSGPAASDWELLDAFVLLARQARWQFTVLAVCDDWDGWRSLGHQLNLHAERVLAPSFGMIPLIVARRPEASNTLWQNGIRAIAGTGSGLSFVLEQEGEEPTADLAGRLAGFEGALDPDGARGLLEHPEARLVSRRLGR
ncbi:MAG: tetratricopeptide repeat protein [Gemmatimonadota bacterium]